MGDVGDPSVTASIQQLKGDDSPVIAAEVKPPMEEIGNANSEGEAKPTTVRTQPPSTLVDRDHVGDVGDSAVVVCIQDLKEDDAAGIRSSTKTVVPDRKKPRRQ